MFNPAVSFYGPCRLHCKYDLMHVMTSDWISRLGFRLAACLRFCERTYQMWLNQQARTWSPEHLAPCCWPCHQVLPFKAYFDLPCQRGILFESHEQIISMEHTLDYSWIGRYSMWISLTYRDCTACSNIAKRIRYLNVSTGQCLSRLNTRQIVSREYSKYQRKIITKLYNLQTVRLSWVLWRMFLVCSK